MNLVMMSRLVGVGLEEISRRQEARMSGMMASKQSLSTGQ